MTFFTTEFAVERARVRILINQASTPMMIWKESSRD